MEWLSWSSPVGIGLFIMLISAAFFFFSQAVYTLTKTGEFEQKMKDKQKE